MNHADLIRTIATMRAEVVTDPCHVKRYAVRVALPAQFGLLAWAGGPLRDVVHAGGFTARRDAADAAPAILAEVAGKMLACVLTPTIDPPPCKTAIGWVQIRLRD
jgi:hypothetical protein